MQLTTMTALNGFINNGGSVTATAAISSPTTSTYQVLPTGFPGWRGTVAADVMYGADSILFTLDGPSGSHASWNGSGSLSVTFSAAVYFMDVGAVLGGVAGNWTHGGSAITANQVFSAGSYTFDFSFSTTSAPGFSGGVWVAFQAASPGGGVPLPGAAGLAACGLLGLSRRRRR